MSTSVTGSRTYYSTYQEGVRALSYLIRGYAHLHVEPSANGRRRSKESKGMSNLKSVRFSLPRDDRSSSDAHGVASSEDPAPITKGER